MMEEFEINQYCQILRVWFVGLIVGKTFVGNNVSLLRKRCMTSREGENSRAGLSAKVWFYATFVVCEICFKSIKIPIITFIFSPRIWMFQVITVVLESRLFILKDRCFVRKFLNSLKFRCSIINVWSLVMRFMHFQFLIVYCIWASLLGNCPWRKKRKRNPLLKWKNIHVYHFYLLGDWVWKVLML